MNYSQQMQQLMHRYRTEVSDEPADPREVAAWAIRKKLWEPQPTDLVSRCARDLTRALREEYLTDEKGRRYRVNHAVTMSKDGEQLSMWANIDTAPRAHMVKAFAQRRMQIVGDCFQLRQDVDHNNDVSAETEPIQLVLDFTEDVEERLYDLA